MIELEAGEIILEAFFGQPFTYRGSSYKAVKSMMITGGCKFTPREDPIHISPLISPMEGPLIQVLKGWRKEAVRVRPYTLNGGPYKVRISWLGSEAFKTVQKLALCLQNTPIATVYLQSMNLERFQEQAAWTVEIELVTPAQITFRPKHGPSQILLAPTPSRIFKPVLRYLYNHKPQYETIAKELDYHTGIVGKTIQQVTVPLDPEKSSAWAITGILTISLGHKAPETLESLLGLLTKALQYTGVGKSRSIGLGMVRTRIVA